MSKITEPQVDGLLVTMKANDASIESKINLLNDLKSSIKHHQVPEPTVAALFDVVRMAMTSQHGSLVGAGCSTLGHLLKRLNLQEPKYILAHGPRILPTILDRLGDQKSRQRMLASQCLTDLWKILRQEVERQVRETGLVSKNARLKESSMQWIAKMNKEHGLQFRSFVPNLVDALEDADGMVRDTAKATVIELFQHAPLPPSARLDLEREMLQRNVRKSIMTEVLSQIPFSAASEPDLHASTQRNHHHYPAHKESIPHEPVHEESRPTSNGSGSQHHDVDPIEPAYVNSQRELDEIFRDMSPHFEGKESEQNWLQREKGVLKLRKLIKGNALRDFQAPFLNAMKGNLLDGILRTANSLRTTLSTNSCFLIQELSKAAGPAIDHMVEILLQSLMKLCAATKRISSKNGNETVDIICANVSYSVRLLQHMWAACQDKNVQPRGFASGWLKTIIMKHGHHRAHLEHTGGLEYMEMCVKKGLSDANPGVRESMRKTYWVFARFFPDKGESVMSSLDANSKRLLEKDPGNPNADKTTHASDDAPAAKAFVRSTAAAPSSRLTLKETIAARKKEAAAAKSLPSRPGSAQSSFSPTLKRGTSQTAAIARLASAPMRPMRPTKRPELMRPATAEPYSMRMSAKTTSPATSPASRFVRDKPKVESPRFTPGRNLLRKPSARSPPRSDISTPDSSGGRNVRKDEELTLVMPRLNNDKVILPAPPGPPKVIEAVRTLPPDPLSPFIRTPPSAGNWHRNGFSPRINSPRRDQVVNSSPRAVDDATNGVYPSIETDVVPAVSPLKVYEDPVGSSEDSTSPRRTVHLAVLEELTINEPVMPASSPLHRMASSPELKKKPSSFLKRSISEQPEDLEQARRLLESGIARVRARSLDAHGFRKLQRLIRGHPDIWPDTATFGRLFSALLDYLQAPNESLDGLVDFNRVQDFKIQVLATVRLMLDHPEERFAPFLPEALCALLRARTSQEARSPLVRDLEETAEKMYPAAAGDECIEAVLGLMEAQGGGRTDKSAISLGFTMLSGCLRARRPHPALPDATTQRLGRMAVRFMNDLDSEVRRDVTTCCVELYELLEPKSRFWQLIGAAGEGHRSLIAYYLARKERGRTGRPLGPVDVEA